MSYEGRIYQVFTSRADSGSDVFQVHPGDYRRGQPADGSVYIRPAGFAPFLNLLRPIVGNSWSREACIGRPHLGPLLEGLDIFSTRIAAARNASELKQVSPCIDVDEACVALVRPQLFRATAAFARVVDVGWRRHGRFSIVRC